jgi:hypothetical protein
VKFVRKNLSICKLLFYILVILNIKGIFIFLTKQNAMKKILFIILIGLASCKKDDPDPVIPVSKDGHLEIEYKTFAPAGTIKTWLKLDGYIIESSDKDTSYYKYDAIVKGGQQYNAYIKQYTTGYRTLLLVKFNGDTLNYHYAHDDIFSFTGMLPFVE